MQAVFRRNSSHLLGGLPVQLLLIWLTLGLLSGTTLWRQWEDKLFDILTVITAPGKVTAPIVIVGIDDPSFADLQLQWPWPRGIHGHLTDQLHSAGAKVIAFDVVFADPSSTDHDNQFAEAIRRAGNVVLAADYVIQERKLFEQAMRVDPLRLFLEAGARSGISAITVDSDVVVRSIPQFEETFWQAIIGAWQEQHEELGPVDLPPPGARIRYLGPDHSFTYVSYYQALNWQEMLPPDTFKNKIVLVGLDMHASPEPGHSQADTFATPFLPATGWLTPGVELEATFVANALLGRSVIETPALAPWLAILAALLASAPGMHKWRPAKSLLTALLVTGITLGLVIWLFAQLDTWLPALSALAAPFLLYLVQGGSAFLHERQQRQRIRKTFEHYVAPAVVEEMIARPELLKLGGTRRKLTLMFTDLAGFTSLSEQMEPEAVAELLNRHLTAMTKIILQHDGTIDKFIGDAIMAFWGAPLEDEQQALHACQAAMKMQAAMRELRKEFNKEGLPPVHMRVGIHTGITVVGNMGSQDRFDYSALGDSVNLAARLEGINKLYGTDILFSESTAHELASSFDITPVDRVRVKGKSEPIDIFTFRTGESGMPDLGAAISAYRATKWDQAEEAWRAIDKHPISRVYLDRISRFRREPPPTDWDGSTAVDKM